MMLTRSGNLCRVRPVFRVPSDLHIPEQQDMAHEHRVAFLPLGVKTTVTDQERIFDAAGAAGLDLASECGGRGTCGRCLIRLIRCYTAPTGNEVHLLSQGKLDQGFRLACQTRVTRNLKVFVPEMTLRSPTTEGDPEGAFTDPAPTGNKKG
jgi:ferredoxin